MSLILNETLKLQANALDRASTACLTVGVLAPIAAAIYNLSGARLDIWIYVVVAAVWFLAAFALHLGARRTLKGLRP